MPSKLVNGIIGASVLRLEDNRHLSGRACFVADVQLPGIREVAFVRSNMAHAKIVSVVPPNGLKPGQFWTAKELASRVHPIVADLKRPEYRKAPYQILATERVRFVGEIIAVVVAQDRASAEDLAEQVIVEFEPLDVISSVEAALAANAAPLHQGWPDNRYMEVTRTIGDIDLAISESEIAFTREYGMARMAPSPLEPRGIVASYDWRLDQLVCYLTTQRPHLLRTMIAEHIVGLDERQVRIVTPDVGGGFGAKAVLYPEDVAVAAISLELGHPIRWIEDRWEAFVATTQSREQTHRITVYAKKSGEILAVDAEIVADGGAYSMAPTTAAAEGNMTANVMPGPYRFKTYRSRTTTACTNKTPNGAYRGVGRPAACFSMERTIDELARVLELDPVELRLRNMIRSDEFPFHSPTGLVYDSGDYPTMLRTAVALLKRDVAKERTSASNTRTGIGYSFYLEQTAHGAEEWRRRGASVGASFESARVRLHQTGDLTIDVGILSHGQGLETTIAQVASDVLAIPYDKISVRHGDTELSSYGLGTIGSRSIVMSGGATYHACLELSEKIRVIGAALLQCPVADVSLNAGSVVGLKTSISFSEIANAAYLNIHLLPKGVQPGLEVLYHYRPSTETGAFSAGVHGAKVCVDVDTGHVTIEDYVIVEDCGRAINPMIVDGQVIGGMAQGIGQALLEELRYSEVGQPLHVNFADYMLPGFVEVPVPRIAHQQTLSPFTAYGMKGTGEGGCIAPPAAIANAITDALKEFHISVDCTPISPASLWLAIEDARISGMSTRIHTRPVSE